MGLACEQHVIHHHSNLFESLHTSQHFIQITCKKKGHMLVDDDR